MGVDANWVQRVNGFLGLEDLAALQGVQAPRPRTDLHAQPPPLRDCQSPEEGNKLCESIFTAIKE